MWNSVKSSYFVRGVGAAFGLLTLLPQVLPFHALDILAGAHYVIIKWNDFAGRIGGLVAELFGVAAIPHQLVTFLVISISIGPFYAISILKSERGQHRGFVQNLGLWMRAVGGFGCVFLTVPFLVSAPPTHIFFWTSLIAIVIPLSVALRFLPAYRAGFIAVIGFVMTMEAVYLMGSQKMREAFDNAVCEQKDSHAPRCISRSSMSLER